MNVHPKPGTGRWLRPSSVVSLFLRLIGFAGVLGAWLGSIAPCIVAQAQDAPVITTPPQGGVVAVGSNFTLTVTATGSGPLSFQWLFNGSPMTNATAATLLLTNLQLSASGDYQVTVADNKGVTTSAVATVTVMVPPSLQYTSPGGLISLGQTLILGFVKEGSLPIYVQWQKDGVNLMEGGRFACASWMDTLGNNFSMVVGRTSYADEGDYRVILTNAVGAVTGAVAHVSLTPVWAWGGWIAYNSGAVFTPPTATNVTAISGGYEHTLLLRGDGSVVAYGINSSGETNVPPEATNLVGIAAGYGESLGLTENGTVLAWGGNGYWATNSPTGLSNIVAIAPGAALRSDGTALRMDGTLISSNMLVVADGLGIRVDGTVLAWGAYSPPYGLNDVIGVARSFIHAVALRRNGTLVPWGYDWGYGTLSIPSSASNVVAVAAGGYHTIVLRGDGTVFGWSNIGSAPADATNVVAIAAGANHGLALVRDPRTRVPPRIFLPPQDRSVFGGSTILMHAGVTGSLPLRHQWLLNGSPLPNQTNTWLYLTNVAPAMAGNYQLVTTNDFGAVTSALAVVSLTGVIGIATQPVDQNIVLGGTAYFGVAPIGVSPFGYQWLRDGTNLVNGGRISGATSPTLAVSGVQTNDSAPYQVVVTNAFGAVTSAVANLTAKFAPQIVMAPTNTSVVLNGTLLFAVAASGSEPLSYQWRRNYGSLVDDGRIQGATTPVLTIQAVQTNDLGNYDVMVSSPYGLVSTPLVGFTLLYPPSVLTEPASRSLPAGTNASFSVTAGGTAPFAYQWRFGTTDLPARTNATLTLTNIQAANAGDYTVVVTNTYGAVTSAIATLAVLPAAPTIATQAVSRVASVGQTVSFKVVARGSEPMTCQWQKEGADVPGATGFTLTLASVNSSMNGSYRAAVSNDYGFVFSTNVTLTVSPVLVWGLTNNPQLLIGSAIPATATNVVAIAGSSAPDGGSPCMALRADGSLVTWGYFSRNPPPPTNAVDLVAVSVAASGTVANSLVLRADGDVVQWPLNTKQVPPPPSTTNHHTVAVATGTAHQLALLDDGTVLAWGDNTYGQTNVPSAASNVIAIAAGNYHNLVLRADGTAVSWGLNTYGQTTALSNATDVLAIAAGGNQSLGLLRNGTLVGSAVTNTGPQVVAYGTPPADATNLIGVAAGQYHTLGLRADTTVASWGYTNYAQTPAPSSATNVLALAAGGYLSMALVADSFAPPLPPRIGRPPLSRSVVAGQPAVFNALAIGGLPLNYQWYRQGIPVVGQTRASLTFTNALPADAGDYQLVAWSGAGTATSAVASVTVTIPQPVLQGPALSNGVFQFSFQGIAGVDYSIQYKQHLEDPAWLELVRKQGVGSAIVVTDSPPVGSNRFYRVAVH